MSPSRQSGARTASCTRVDEPKAVTKGAIKTVTARLLPSTLTGEAPRSPSIEASGKQRMTQRTEHRRPTGVHRRLQAINRTHPSTLYSVGKPVFVDFPAIFVILQPQSSSLITLSGSSCSATKLA